MDISSGAIRVAVLEGSSQRVLMEGKLTHKINTESSLWSLEPGKCVLVRVVRGQLCLHTLACSSAGLDPENCSSWKFEPDLHVWLSPSNVHLSLPLPVCCALPSAPELPLGVSSNGMLAEQHIHWVGQGGSPSSSLRWWEHICYLEMVTVS